MTPMHEHEARTRLQGVAPGARPDVDAIIRTGRRRNRTAALGTAAAAVVVLAGVGVGAALLWQPPTRDAVPAPLQTPSSAPTTSAPQPTASSTPEPTPTPTKTPDAQPRSWPSVRGEAGGGLTVDGKSVGRPMGPDVEALPFADFVTLMGTPDEQTTSATCGERALKNTLYRWGDLKVVVLDEEDKGNDYGFAYPPGEVAGWAIDPTFDGEPGLSFPMTGPNGAQIGDTVAQLQALFPQDEWDYSAADEDSYDIFAGDTTGATFPLDADKRVKAMSAGYGCQIR